MNYKGKDLNRESCELFLKDFCTIEKTSMDENYLEIEVRDKKTRMMVAEIVGFLYNYKRKYSYGKNNAFHIKTLGTMEEYERKGIATYLMKNALLYAEAKGVKHVTVHPSASTASISQEDLERFYKKFTFEYSCFLKRREKEIEFRIVAD